MGYRYIGSKARIADEIIEYVKETATMESGGFLLMPFLEPELLRRKLLKSAGQYMLMT